MGKGKTDPAAKRGNAVGNVFRTIGVTFKEGDWKTRISYIILGFGELLRGHRAQRSTSAPQKTVPDDQQQFSHRSWQ